MNAKFEKWCDEMRYCTERSDTNQGVYWNIGVHGLWQAWQAAIAQIEVTDDLVEVGTDALPVAVHEEFGYRQCANYMRAALTAVIAKIREGEV